MGIFERATQATALNEYRGCNIEFPLELILGMTASDDRNRIERGLLGAHSDIGGGFPDQDEIFYEASNLGYAIDDTRQKYSLASAPDGQLPLIAQPCLSSDIIHP